MPAKTRVCDFCSNNDIHYNSASNRLRQCFFQDRLFLVMEYVSGSELMSLICKRGGFGEKRSRYVYQFKQTTLNTVARNRSVFWGASAFWSERHLRLKLGRGLGETKTPRKGVKPRPNHRNISTQHLAKYIVGSNICILHVVRVWPPRWEVLRQMAQCC